MIFQTLSYIIFFVIVERFFSKELKSMKEIVCNALCLSGGGDHGAYEAGVVKALTEQSNHTGYEVVVGTSIGAINSAVFGQFKLGDDVNAAKYLVHVWSEITKANFYENWIPGGVAEGLLLKDAIFNTANAAKKTYDKYMNKTMLQNSGRIVNFCATDLKDGSLKRFAQDYDDLFTALKASSAISGIFSPARIGDNFYVDGGFSEYNTPISTAIRECEKKYYPGVKIQVDVTQDLIPAATPKVLQSLKAIPILLRTLLDMANTFLCGDIEYSRREWPNASIRVISPSEHLPSYLYIEFKHKEIMEMIDIGYEDGKKALAENM